MPASEEWTFSGFEPGEVDAWPASIEPYLLITTDEQWANYSNPELYDFEKRLRKFLEHMQHNGKFSSIKDRKFTYRMMYQRLYGTNPPSQYDGQANAQRAVMAWYSGRIITDTMIGDKRVKNCYVMQLSRLRKPPWCLKLRLEWYLEQGVEPSQAQMRLHHKQLQPGHARFPRTERNMEARRERAKERARESVRATRAKKQDEQR